MKSMSYQKGQHQKGIKNETFVCKFLTEVNHYGCELRHRGGTKVVEDGDTENGDKSSFKKWKTNSSTHDWFNCSPLAAEIELKDLIKLHVEQFKKDIKNVPDAEHETFRKKKENKMKRDIAETLDQMCTDEFADKCMKKFISHSKDLDIIVTDVQNKKVLIYKFNEHPAVVYYNKGYKPVFISRSGKKSASRNIILVKDDDKVDIGLRIRFVESNGFKPFTCEPSPNKSTTATIKMQQDNVKNILSNVNKICYNY